MEALVIETQYYENYGDDVVPYWKPKGGTSLWIANVPEDCKAMHLLIADYFLSSTNGDWAREVLISVDTMPIQDASCLTHEETPFFDRIHVPYEGVKEIINPRNINGELWTSKEEAA